MQRFVTHITYVPHTQIHTLPQTQTHTRLGGIIKIKEIIPLADTPLETSEISLGRVGVPSPKIHIHILCTNIKLNCDEEPYRFSGYIRLMVFFGN